MLNVVMDLQQKKQIIYMTYFMGKMHKLSAVIMQKMVRIG